MLLTFRPIKVWPDDWSPAHARRPRAPFDGKYGRTLLDLDRELRHLEGSEPFLQLDVADADVRLDGQLRSSAAAAHPGVILTFQTANLGPLTYATDAFDHWHGNLRAIALGLDCLRRVERYGIGSRGQQYAGYRELPSGIALGPAPMTRDIAAKLIADGLGAGRRLTSTDVLRWWQRDGQDWWRALAKEHHPDQGGDPDVFRKMAAARDVLDAPR